MTCWLSPPVNFLPYLSFLFPGSDLYGHSLTLALEGPATCMWHSLSRPWDLQATMHFPGEGTSLRNGGWAQIHLCWMVLGLGWRNAQVSSGILRSMASQQPAFVFCWCTLLFLASGRHRPFTIWQLTSLSQCVCLW
uniref:Uncharacterized protein n=1 Tax=Rousettus aegyptiacus TaxID=9407 RepID=A0A7J8IMD4_ROUAE|nr:hypothetical protein HJG63_010649 [Rousettus aegyptiacus]